VGDDGPGLDAIVGQQKKGSTRGTFGLPDGKEQSSARIDLDSWVIQRGGEYFFTPSKEALDKYITAPADYTNFGVDPAVSV